MEHQKSCGVIPYTIKNKEIYVLLVKQTNDVVGFPKGHVEAGESEEETALRECLEETAARVRLVAGFRQEIGYYMEEYDAYKTVVYFLGQLENGDFTKQESEISEICLCPVQEAMDRMIYENQKDLLAKAVAFIEPGSWEKP